MPKTLKMTTRDFQLHPFDPSDRLNGDHVSGTIIRQENLLIIFYEFYGDLDLIQIPKPAKNPARKHRLWKTTCFELFIQVDGSDGYLEFNLSPSGNWNIYRFDGYRKGMSEALPSSMLPFNVTRSTNLLKIELEIHLDNIFPPNVAIRAGISAVTKTLDNNITYWALIHPAPKPDFHHPDSFMFEL